MKTYNGLQFTPFKEDDVVVLTPIMKRAFDEDSRRHLNQETGGPPGYDNGDFLKEWALHKNSTALKILKDNKPIGCVILWINRNNNNFLGNIFIDTQLQDQGLGLIAWKFIESEYPETKKWTTETSGFSKRNHHFYMDKCGFELVRIENQGDIDECYILEKNMSTK